MDIYKFAAQHGLRFPTVRGDLIVEQLFDLPLTSKSGFDLDSIAKAVNKGLKATAEESFVSSTVNPARKPLEVALEIVKDVIATKQEENAAAALRAERAARRYKILTAIGDKKDRALSDATLEELEKQLSELDV